MTKITIIQLIKKSRLIYDRPIPPRPGNRSAAKPAVSDSTSLSDSLDTSSSLPTSSSLQKHNNCSEQAKSCCMSVGKVVGYRVPFCGFNIPFLLLLAIAALVGYFNPIAGGILFLVFLLITLVSWDRSRKNNKGYKPVRNSSSSNTRMKTLKDLPKPVARS